MLITSRIDIFFFKKKFYSLPGSSLADCITIMNADDSSKVLIADMKCCLAQVVMLVSEYKYIYILHQVYICIQLIIHELCLNVFDI